MKIRDLHEWIVQNDERKSCFEIMCGSRKSEKEEKQIAEKMGLKKDDVKFVIKIIYFLATIGYDWKITDKYWKEDEILTGGVNTAHNYASSILNKYKKSRTLEELLPNERPKAETEINFLKDCAKKLENEKKKEKEELEKLKKELETEKNSAEEDKKKQKKAICEQLKNDFKLSSILHVDWLLNPDDIETKVLNNYDLFLCNDKNGKPRTVIKGKNTPIVVYKLFQDIFVKEFYGNEEEYLETEIEKVFEDYGVFVNTDVNKIKEVINLFLNQQNVSEVSSENDLCRLEYGKNIIFYGPPGTGKTRKAKILAYEILTKDNGNENIKTTDSAIIEEVRKIIQDTSGRIKLVQFHPSYSYNDFMESIEFSGGCCDYKDKIFKDFASDAKKAAEKAKESGNTAPAYVLIIDEINRANVSNVLGELLYGLEYREQEFSTAVKGGKFSVPENLYIIGTMNTADRSLQNLDYAVRRRFSFEKVSAELPAAMETGKSGSDCYMVEGNKYFYKTIFEKVKGHVEASVARGVNAEDILPGISYFLVEGTKPEDRKDHLTYKIKYELIPLLKEYAKDGMFTKRKKIVGDKSLIDVLKDKEYEELLLK